MNLSHVIHEFSFGPYFPAISQPLDNSVETTQAREWRSRHPRALLADRLAAQTFTSFNTFSASSQPPTSTPSSVCWTRTSTPSPT